MRMKVKIVFIVVSVLRQGVQVVIVRQVRPRIYLNPAARTQLNIGVTLRLCGNCGNCGGRSPDGRVDGYAGYPANPAGGAERCFVGVVGVLLGDGVGITGGGGARRRIPLGGWPIIRESDQGRSIPERDAAEMYRAISRWRVG